MQDAVCVSSSLSESYSRIAAAAMDMFFVYATSMPATCLILPGSWSSRMRSLDIRCCARWAIVTEKVAGSAGFSSMFLSGLVFPLLHRFESCKVFF